MIASLVKLKIKERGIYSFDLLTQILSYPLRLIVLLILWSILLQGDNTISGFNLSAIILYFTFQRIISDGLQMGDFAENFQDEILEGSLDASLTKPVKFHYVKFSEMLANLFFSLLSLVYLPIVMILVPGITDISLWNWLNFTFYFIMAVLIGFLISFIFGLIPLFLGRSTPLISTFFLIIGLISGSTFPIQMLPDMAVNILQLTPFFYLYTAPLSFIVSPVKAINPVVPISWILILILISSILWKNGMKRYSGQGG